MSTEYYWYIFHQGRLLLPENTAPVPPPRTTEPPFSISGPLMELGLLNGVHCRGGLTEETPPDSGWLSLDLYNSYNLLSPESLSLAGRAAQLVYWQQNSLFCPVCGAATGLAPGITAKLCPNCGKLIFPKATAAVLVLVQKGESLLLVRAHNFRGPFYGLVAGYLDVGESLEDCARREVMEETGLSINNLRYFGSDPWPFPNNIMIGFIADYVSGEIVLQEEELAEAAFFTRRNMPQLPGKMSLTRKMIDWWLSQGREPGGLNEK